LFERGGGGKKGVILPKAQLCGKNPQPTRGKREMGQKVGRKQKGTTTKKKNNKTQPQFAKKALTPSKSK